MKEKLIIELERSDVEDAISSFLNEKGYKVKKVSFKLNTSASVPVIDGANVTVTKKEEHVNE